MKMRTRSDWIGCLWIYCWCALLLSALAKESYRTVGITPRASTSSGQRFKRETSTQPDRAPEILRSPSNVSAIVDRNLTLTCTVDGHPVPDIFWQKRDISTNRWEQIIRGANSNRFRMPHGRLIIRRLLIIDTGYYRCSALNKIGSAYSGLAYLSVQAPVTIVSPPKNQTVTWGLPVELQCEVIGIPFPHRWWTKNGQLVVDKETQMVFTDPRLPINATETTTYECLAENHHSEGYTNVSQAAVVTVIGNTDGHCGSYNGDVCKRFLMSQPIFLKRSKPSAIHESEVYVRSLLEAFKEVANVSCLEHMHKMLCHYSFWSCVSGGKNKEGKQWNLCRETCLAVKELLCEQEWLLLEGRNISLPDCNSLPNRHPAPTACNYVDLFNITEDQITTSCYRGTGSHYRGPVNVTVDGLQCQPWSKQVPNRHNRMPGIYPILQDSGNACRNAGGERPQPWCFTMNATVPWQFCDVSPCDAADAPTVFGSHVPSAFNIELAFIIAPSIAILLTLLILAAVICFRIILPAIRKPQKHPSSDIDISELVQLPKPDTDYPVPMLEHLEYHQRNSIAHQEDLAEGAFGKFFLARAPNIVSGQDATAVVVKVLQLRATPEMEQDFIREVQVLAQFHHPNILRILGVCLVGRPWFVLLEYMQHGDLNGFLQNCIPEQFIVRRRSGSSFERDGPRLSCREQLRIARQIAAAMLYVVEMRYVHRDLATRNCLVGSELTVKISDFGLAVALQPDEVYHQGGEFEPIPIRWSPLESIVYNQFTHASDVWSFGIVLWEIFSFGERPYHNMSQEEVVRYVREGRILFCPDNTPSDVYELMHMCWSPKPTERPGFGVLHKTLCSLEEREEAAEMRIGALGQ